MSGAGVRAQSAAGGSPGITALPSGNRVPRPWHGDLVPRDPLLRGACIISSIFGLYPPDAGCTHLRAVTIECPQTSSPVPGGVTAPRLRPSALEHDNVAEISSQELDQALGGRVGDSEGSWMGVPCGAPSPPLRDGEVTGQGLMQVKRPARGPRVLFVSRSEAPPSSWVALGTAAACLGRLCEALAEEMSSLFQACPHVPGPRTGAGTRASSLPVGAAPHCAFQDATCAPSCSDDDERDAYPALGVSPLPSMTRAAGGLTPFPQVTRMYSERSSLSLKSQSWGAAGGQPRRLTLEPT